jgi:hypothetical protein
MDLMNKTQALAAMEAQVIRATAERKRRLEKRQQYLLRLYPALKRAPIDLRFDLLREARRHAFRQWSVYAALAVLLLASGYLLRDQFTGIVQDVPAPTVLVLSALALVPVCVLYFHIRTYLHLRIGDHKQDHERVLTQRGA